MESDIETRSVSALRGLDVPYELVKCDPAFADTAAFCDKYGYTLEQCGNTILVASKREPKQFAACVVRGSDRLDVNRTVRRLMSVSRVSFASEELTKAVTGMMLGGVTPFGLPEDVPLYVDERLMSIEKVILGSGSRSSKIRVSPAVFGKIPGATVVPGLSIGA